MKSLKIQISQNKYIPRSNFPIVLFHIVDAVSDDARTMQINCNYGVFNSSNSFIICALSNAIFVRVNQMHVTQFELVILFALSPSIRRFCLRCSNGCCWYWCIPPVKVKGFFIYFIYIGPAEWKHLQYEKRANFVPLLLLLLLCCSLYHNNRWKLLWICSLWWMC